MCKNNCKCVCECTPKGHPHAELMAHYAEDAKVHPRPWELWQRRVKPNGRWTDHKSSPAWWLDREYRRKPRTININGYEVPEPERVAPSKNTRYYFPSFINKFGVFDCSWKGDGTDIKVLQKGLLHLTSEAAELHAKALLSFTRKE